MGWLLEEFVGKVMGGGKEHSKLVTSKHHHTYGDVIDAGSGGKGCL